MKRTLRSRRWAPSLAAVAAFGVLGATCAYWALQLFAPPIAIAPAGSIVDTRSAPELVGAQALFGSTASDTPIAAPADLEIRVLGVAANPSRGSAVLVVDSGAARAFLVGDEIGTGLRLVEVRSEVVVLERNGIRIELPAPQRPSVALLSSGPRPADAAGADEASPVGLRAAERNAADDAATTEARTPTPGAPAGAIRQPTSSAERPDDPAIEAATPSPRGGGAAIDPSRFSGIRGSRAIGAAANADAPAPGAVR